MSTFETYVRNTYTSTQIKELALEEFTVTYDKAKRLYTDHEKCINGICRSNPKKYATFVSDYEKYNEVKLYAHLKVEFALKIVAQRIN